MRPLVSINIVSFNSEKFISRAIKSVLDQNFSRWEIIIVDNGSTDNTLKIVDTFLKRNKKIKVFKLRKPNQPKARNLAIKKSLSNLIAVLDSDDECEKNRLEIQYKFMKENKNVNFLGSYTNVIDEQNNFLHQNKYPSEPNLIKFSFLFGNPIAHSSLVFRKKLDYLYDEKLKFSQDREMLTRYINNSIYSNIPMPLIKFRVHKGQMNKEKFRIQKINEFDNLKRNYQILFDKYLHEKYITAIISTRNSRECNLDQLELMSNYLLMSYKQFQIKFYNGFENNLLKNLSKKKLIEFSVMCNSNILKILKVYSKNTELFSLRGVFMIVSRKVFNILK